MDSHWCEPCGKWGYHSRRDAKAARRRFHKSEPGMRAYPCPERDNLWHFGHLPDIVRRRGLIAADDLVTQPYRQPRRSA